MIISETGKAQICDYGLTPIISNPTLTVVMTGGVVTSPRWLAPEIIKPPSETSSKPITASKPADVFAFAMLAVEVFTGKVPFDGNTDNGPVAIQIIRGKRPSKPQDAEQLGLTAEMWKFIETCWSGDPGERPTIDEVVRTWEGFVNRYVVLSFGSYTSRWIRSGDNSPVSSSKASGRHSQFADPSAVYTGKPGEST